MKKLAAGACAILVFFTTFAAFGQNHGSVSLDHEIYYILEQCETRGLCSDLPPVRPWTRSLVLSRVNEALTSAVEGPGALRDSERRILENYRDDLGDATSGLDLRAGSYSARTEIGTSGVEISGKAGVGVDIEASAGLYPGDTPYGMETWVNAFLAGDIGRNVSYGFSFSGGIIRVPREELGTYHTYYEGYISPSTEGTEYYDRIHQTYSQPLTHFPYAYRKRWDGSIHTLEDINGFGSWPNSFAFGYNENFELTGNFLDGRLLFRLGRFGRDWGLTPVGSSLALSQAARPFLGIEGSFTPFSWFSLSTLAGTLEYFNELGITDSAESNQNGFSITMLEFKYKNYLFLDVGQGNIWPKRWELGYLSSFASFYYQNNIGDFDNTVYFMNFKAQYPGFGNLWVSTLLDEVMLDKDIFTLDRFMWTYQGGVNVHLPFLSFASLKLSYTKVEPYCYTHTTVNVPWYRTAMEQAYTNNGVGLGSYLPPNTDELLLRFELKPTLRSSSHFQYQMIRHGADYGSSAVDGSSFVSELDPSNRSSNPVLEKYFLHDGAYQWYHILKLGGEHSFNISGAPLFRVSAEAGMVFSQFSNIEGQPNSGASSPYHMIDTAEYPRRIGFVFSLGVRIFPRI
ncbi:MAG: hypothetical protein LBU00_07100 [Treponema sp.]|jgi:hypothetical protein|nr:hypothetical protein [Treponema sp.]